MHSFMKEHYLALEQHQRKIKLHSLHRLFEEDELRADRFTLKTEEIYFDFSKNHINHDTLRLLCEFAEQQKLPQMIQSLFNGEHVNNTEDRPALHTALRFQGTPSTKEQQLSAEVRNKMALCVEKIHTHQWLGFTGKPITTVVNIGIGGSDLGSRMVVQALPDHHKNIDVKFIANIDGADLSDTLSAINPETTLFIIASKTFSTLETIENALSAKHWLTAHNCKEDQLAKHFIAVSMNTDAAKLFGVDENNIFPIWDWVGGRYSLWSAIGLPIAIALGMNNYQQLLEGANAMDSHYRNTPLLNNLPVIAGLITFWYGQFWQTKAHAILPYAQRLHRLPAYLQQLDMESLGKSVSSQGKSLTHPTGGIIWGAEGTNGQHSFHQLLHQGTELIPADFIAIKKPMSPLDNHHQLLQACCISQSQALLKGKSLADAEQELRDQGLSEAEIKTLAPHKVVAGNKPSNTLVLEALTPKNLGALIAFYEHKVYTLGVLLDINPFDQWGVELGKQLGTPIHNALSGDDINIRWDSSTKALIKLLSP
jgi:glucose-6-phosphate isomerase